MLRIQKGPVYDATRRSKEKAKCGLEGGERNAEDNVLCVPNEIRTKERPDDDDKKSATNNAQ